MTVALSKIKCGFLACFACLILGLQGKPELMGYPAGCLNQPTAAAFLLAALVGIDRLQARPGRAALPLTPPKHGFNLGLEASMKTGIALLLWLPLAASEPWTEDVMCIDHTRFDFTLSASDVRLQLSRRMRLGTSISTPAMIPCTTGESGRITPTFLRLRTGAV